MRLGVTHPGRRVPDVEVRCNAPRKKGTRRYIMLLPRDKGVTHPERRVPDVEIRCNALHPLPVPAARSRCSSPLPVPAAPFAREVAPAAPLAEKSVKTHTKFGIQRAPP